MNNLPQLHEAFISSPQESYQLQDVKYEVFLLTSKHPPQRKKLTSNYTLLAKEIGDLLYAPLASLLYEIETTVNGEEIKTLLKEAGDHISQAWKYCEPHMKDISIYTTQGKHTSTIKSTPYSIPELGYIISQLPQKELQILLYHLSVKLMQDSIADYNRGRKKLSKQLEESAHKLGKVSQLISY